MNTKSVFALLFLLVSKNSNSMKLTDEPRVSTDAYATLVHEWADLSGPHAIVPAFIDGSNDLLVRVCALGEEEELKSSMFMRFKSSKETYTPEAVLTPSSEAERVQTKYENLLRVYWNSSGETIRIRVPYFPSTISHSITASNDTCNLVMEGKTLYANRGGDYRVKIAGNVRLFSQSDSFTTIKKPYYSEIYVAILSSYNKKKKNDTCTITRIKKHRNGWGEIVLSKRNKAALTLTDGKFCTLAWNANNTLLALGTRDGRVMLWNHVTKKTETTLLAGTGLVHVAWHPTDTTLLITGESHKDTRAQLRAHRIGGSSSPSRTHYLEA